ncbi:hypothetical protein BJ085DRAFT_38868 [Dimargaris cristalligena]|uniref:DNA recombination and repair protein Rad51-like C-terminal domain-containing protein n=1 Tax=Dimargaris cristalligena TaxID=215637 RepID=A0A4P9ZW12_9FUNG|nr:hypothetical protein BJ085DRAFT_38868 [Dimargaris cristalligena]|eukprot:RKP37836.1 hypothetical protein BJ085DRAFT_38868 [Dimargaris cristalligena]
MTDPPVHHWTHLLNCIESTDGYQLYRALKPTTSIAQFDIDAIDTQLLAARGQPASPTPSALFKPHTICPGDRIELMGYSNPVLVGILYTLIAHSLISSQDLLGPRSATTPSAAISTSGCTVILLDLQGDLQMGRLRQVLISRIKRQLLLTRAHGRHPQASATTGPGGRARTFGRSEFQLRASQPVMRAVQSMVQDDQASFNGNLDQRAEAMADVYLSHLVVLRPQSTTQLIATLGRLPHLVQDHYRRLKSGHGNIPNPSSIAPSRSLPVSQPSDWDRLNLSSVTWSQDHSPDRSSPRRRGSHDPSLASSWAIDSTPPVPRFVPPRRRPPAIPKQYLALEALVEPPLRRRHQLLLLHNISAFYWIDKTDGFPRHDRASSVASLMNARVCHVVRQMQRESDLAVVATTYMPLQHSPREATTMTRMDDSLRPGAYIPFQDLNFPTWRSFPTHRFLVMHATLGRMPSHLNNGTLLSSSPQTKRPNIPGCFCHHSPASRKAVPCQCYGSPLNLPTCGFRAIAVASRPEKCSLQVLQPTKGLVLTPFGQIMTLAE